MIVDRIFNDKKGFGKFVTNNNIVEHLNSLDKKLIGEKYE